MNPDRLSTAELPELVFLVGIPASGKSTYAVAYQEKGYALLSSDCIRAQLARGELYPEDPGALHALNRLVFEEIRQRAVFHLRQGQSVVVDATNLGRKRRITFLSQLRRIPCRKICLLFVTPHEVCRARNAARNGEARVPEDAMQKMLCNFECPMKQEGWEEIRPIAFPQDYRFPFEKTVGFSQDNPHHTLTLHDHLSAARQFVLDCGGSEDLQLAAYYHDIGKLYTKDFHNHKGEPSEAAHFYGHENYSAYLFLTEFLCNRDLSSEEVDRILYLTALINCHMRPLRLWRGTPTVRQKDRLFFGETFFQDLTVLHQADRHAH